MREKESAWCCVVRCVRDCILRDVRKRVCGNVCDRKRVCGIVFGVRKRACDSVCDRKRVCGVVFCVV